MPTTRRNALFTLAAGLTAHALPTAAPAAAAFPSRPVTIVVPTPQGGPSDTAARLLARALATAWGQQVNVENQAGASGALAARAVLDAAPDGHTLLWGLAAMAGLPFVQKAPPYRSMAELVPVATVVHMGYALFVNRDVPVQNFADLVAHGRANPERLRYATGVLTEYAMAVELLGATGIKAQRVPYNGGAHLMPDLVNGKVQVYFGPILNGLPLVRAGKLKVLATALLQRSKILPDVPTLAELNVPAGTMPSWNGLFAPRGTPRNVVDAIARAVASTVKEPSVRDPLAENGVEVAGDGPPQLAEAVDAATAAWKAFVQQHQIPLE